MSVRSLLMGPARLLLARCRQMVRRVRTPPRRSAHPDPERVTVSVVVPMKNAGPDVSALIVRMKEQKGFRGVEVIIVDSGSTDGSRETAEALGATLVRIPPEDFSHSYARNLGAERASGDYLLFTVQDALPPSDRWLHEMFSGLRRHGVAAVSCGEEPHADSDLFYRVISWYHHRFMSQDGGDRVMARPADDDPLKWRRNAQLSDTACLIARELFLRYRHRGRYAEDLDLGLRLIGDGYRLAFLASPRIIHSHNRPAYYHLKRSYVEHLALFDMLPGYQTVPGDGAAAASDIVRSSVAIDGVVQDGLLALSPPCSPRQVRDAVTDVLRRSATAPASTLPTPTEYVDDRMRAFVWRLRDRHAAAGESSDPAQGSLVRSVGGVATMICDYLEDASQPLDAALLDEFKAALYKGWAVHCGVRLASAWWRGPEQVRESMRAVHDDLTKDV